MLLYLPTCTVPFPKGQIFSPHFRCFLTATGQLSPCLPKFFSSPSEIEWLCVDVNGYKLINVYKPPPTRLRSLDLLVFPHPCLYAGDFNCHHIDWVTTTAVWTVSAWMTGKVLIVRSSPFFPHVGEFMDLFF